MAFFRFLGPQCTEYSKYWLIDPETLCRHLSPAPGIVASAGSVKHKKKVYAAKHPGAAVEFSGAAWWHANQKKYPNKTDIESLATEFQAKVKEFVDALHAAHAKVHISTTRRSKQRAYLMHYSWRIAKGEVDPAHVPAKSGVHIIWDHHDDTKSRAAAQEMVDLFHMAHIAVLKSRHISGLAIDMTITWEGTLKIKNKSATIVEIGTPRNGAENTTLHTVGNSYGVKKLLNDAPHWSADGH